MSFPPKAGWRQRLLRRGVPAACPYPAGFAPPDGAAEALALNPLVGPACPVPVEIPDDALRIFTDGSGSPDAGSGGWSFVAYRGPEEVHASLGGRSSTTNNRMELFAAIEALRWLAPGAAAILWTDSHYVVRGALERRHGWRRTNWMRGAGDELANRDLWQVFDPLFADRLADIRWTRGHSGSPGNERADELARLGRRLFACRRQGGGGRD